MNRERLNRLADFLDTLDPERFSIHTWATGDLHECGTVGCAAGWATMIPEFAEAGLKLVPSTTWESGRNISYRGATGLTALETFFSISPVDAVYLFVGIRYPASKSLAAVRDRIRSFANV
jgi:hypothetical protein